MEKGARLWHTYVMAAQTGVWGLKTLGVWGRAERVRAGVEGGLRAG